MCIADNHRMSYNSFLFALITLYTGNILAVDEGFDRIPDDGHCRISRVDKSDEFAINPLLLPLRSGTMNPS